MKYIIILDIEHKKEYPFIFAANLVHKDVAERSIHLIKKSTEGWKEFKVIAAGFCNISKISCNGDSETLHVMSRKAIDVNCIADYNYTHGIQN